MIVRDDRTRRSAVLVVAGVAVIVAAQASLAETARPPWLGVRAEPVGDRLVAVWVQPGGHAWDAGVRPGDVVLAVDGRPPSPADGAIDAAQSVRVSQPGGAELSASVTMSPVLRSRPQRAFYLALGASFAVLGAFVFAVAGHRRAARVVLGFSLAAATMFIVAPATMTGNSWPLAVEFLAVAGFGGTTLLLFLVFPVDRLSTRLGQTAAAACAAATAVLAVLYAWSSLVDSAAYGLTRWMLFAVLASELLAALILAAASLRTVRVRSEAQRLVRLVVIGAALGVAPFCALAIGPYLLGFDFLVSPDIAIMTIVFLPVSLAVAVASRQFLGIEQLLRRGVVAVVVWALLLVGYVAGLEALLASGPVGQGSSTHQLTVVIVVAVAATFWAAQHVLRRSVERLFFPDIYDYATTLHRLGTEIAGLTEVGAIARHVLQALGKTLDLRWAVIEMGGDARDRFVWGEAPLEPVEPGVADEPRPAPGDSPAAFVLPLSADLEPVGTLVLGPKRRDVELSSQDQSMAATLAPLVGTVLRNALLLKRLEAQVAALEEREQALGALSVRLMQVQEEERQHLALDLHDDPLQRALLLLRAVDGAPTNATTAQYRRGLEEIVDSLRAISIGLRPPVLDDFGLVAAIEQLVRATRSRSDVDVALCATTIDGSPFGRLNPELEVALYRVAQEALTNCEKHASATCIQVELVRATALVRLTVVDDGLGIDGPTARAPVGFGLMGMHERLRPWGGRLDVRARPGRGTVLSAEVPLDQQPMAVADTIQATGGPGTDSRSDGQ